MKKSFLKVLVLFVFFFSLFGSHAVFAQQNTTENTDNSGSALSASDYANAVLSGLGAMGGFTGAAANTLNAGIQAPKTALNTFLDPLGITSTIMSWFLQLWLFLITGALIISGYLFDFFVSFAIDSKSIESLTGTIRTLWAFIRDLANLAIVFSLLYLAIKTIIEGEGFADKKKLISVLLAAVLINFSLFFTQFAFNLSNDVATLVRNQITVGSAPTSASGLTADTSPTARQGSLSEGIGQSLGVPKQLEYIATQGNTGLVKIGIQTQYLLVLTFSVVGVVFILLFGAGLLLYRFIVFIFLMIFSAAGLVSLFIPGLKKYGDMWFGRLKALSIIAPVYFLTFYVCLTLLSAITKMEILNSSSSFKENVFGTFLAMIVQGALIFGTLLGTVLLPTKLGAAGGKAIGDISGWAEKKVRAMPGRAGGLAAGGVGRLGRETIGRGSNAFLKSNFIQNGTTKSGVQGALFRGAGRVLNAGATSSMDARQVKIGGQTLGKKYGLGEANKGQQGGFKGVRSEKAKAIKDRWTKDAKIFEAGYDNKIKAQRGQDLLVHQTGLVQNTQNLKTQQAKVARWETLSQKGGRAGSVAKQRLVQAKEEEKKAQKLVDTSTQLVQNTQEKIISGKVEANERNKIRADILNTDRRTVWAGLGTIISEGHRASMERGAKDIAKGEDPEEKKNKDLAKAIAAAAKADK